MRALDARLGRRALAPLFCLLGISLSCAITPTPAPVAESALASTAESAPAPALASPAFDAVRSHMERYAARSGLTAGERDVVARTILEESARHDLDPALVLAVIHVESRFDTYAVSPVYALGLMQVMPATGEWLAPTVGVEWRGPETLFDPVANVRLGIAYLRQLTDRYDGSIRTALLAYNWGPGRIDRRLRTGTPLPREYAQLVLTAYQPSS